MLEKLRDEIIESQKARTDLIKWKLILVAAIGGAAFGIGSTVTGAENPPVVLLALVPIVCLFVDAVCIHNEIRILMIARFIRGGALGAVPKQYEDYCREIRLWWFSLEEAGLLLTTVGLSALIGIAGSSDLLRNLMTLPKPVDDSVSALLQWSGAMGVTLGLLFHVVYFYNSHKLDHS